VATVTNRRRETIFAALGALLLCVLTVAIGSDAPFTGGSILGAVALICLARNVRRRWTDQDVMRQLETGRESEIIIGSEPLISMADDECEHRGGVVIDVGIPERDDRILRWLEHAPKQLRALQGILCDYDRLEKAAHEAEEENQSLREKAGVLEKQLDDSERERKRLQQEVSRLQTRVEQYRQGIAVTAAALVDGLDHLQGVFEQLQGDRCGPSPHLCSPHSEVRAPTALSCPPSDPWLE
jgi:hypothetical protein